MAACAILRSRHPVEPPPRVVAGGRSPHRLAITMRLVVAVFPGLTSSEIFMSPPLMAPRQTAVPAGLPGGWQGEARIMNTWINRRTVHVELAVGRDGMAEGTVGDARFLQGRLPPKRSRFGRALRLQADYMFKGKLEGPVVVAEAIDCGPEAVIVFDLEGSRLSGRLGLSCTGAATKGRAPVSIAFKLDRKPVATP